MAVFYLKNTSGSKKTVGDLGLILATGQSTIIDSNNIDGYLTSEMQAALLAGSSSGLVLSTTDIGDTSGDLTPTNAIKALTITTRYDVDNPHKTTFTQTISEETATDVTAAELERLTDGSDVSSATELHSHDTRYYTKTQLTNSNSGTVSVNWDNIINAPSFGSVSWQSQVIVKVLGITDDVSSETWSPESGDFYVNSINGHIYSYDGSDWNDYYTPVDGLRIINTTDNHIYSYDSGSWVDTSTPDDNWALLVNNDGDGKPAQYVFDTATNAWIKIADIDWGDHNSLGGRDSVDSHPASAISFDNSQSTLLATSVQEALTELSIETSSKISNIVYVAKNGQDTVSYPNSADNLGSMSLPYLTIQAAISSIPTSGANAASSTNRYAVVVAPGDYEENITLSKAYVYITGLDRTSSRILTDSGNTLTMSSSTENVNGLYDITIVSTSSSSSDSALLLNGNNQEVKDVVLSAPNGAKSIYITGTYNQRIQHAVIESGEFRIDAGVSYLNTVHSSSNLNITGGTARLVDCNFINTSSDAIMQSGGTLYYVSGKIESETSSLDFNQTAGTLYLGWIDYNKNKVLFDGTKKLLFKSQDLNYDNTTSELISTNVQDAIDELVDQTSAQLTKYIVGKDTFDSYSTIQSAIDASVVDGVNPALIFVKPGTYVENLTIPSGIHITSLNENTNLTKIEGTIAYSADGESSIHGIEIEYISDSVISIDGTGTLFLSNCNVVTESANPAIEINNTSAHVEIKESSITNNSTGSAITLINGNVILSDSYLKSTVDSVILNNGSMISAESVNFGAPLAFLNTSFGAIKNSTISNGTYDAISYNSSSQLLLIDTIQIGTGALSSGTTTSNIIIRKNAKDVAYDNSISGLNSINVQDAIDEIEDDIKRKFHSLIYVDINRVDPYSANGSQLYPFKTITEATVVATNGMMIIVSDGSYTENVILPQGVGLKGMGTAKTYLTGTLTTTGSAFVNIGAMSLYGDFLLTSKALLEDIFIKGQLEVNAAVALTAIEGRNVTISPTTGEALVIGSNVELFRLSSGALYSNDGSSVLLATSGVIALDNYIIAMRTVASSNPTISLTGTTNIELHQSIVQSMGGNTIVSTASGTYPNMLSDVQYAGGLMNFNNSPTIIEGVLDILSGTKSPSGNALIKRPGEQIAYTNTISGLTSTNVQGAIDELNANITSFKMPKGTAFPALPEDGDLFYRTDLSLPYQYDASRAKWLTMTKQTLDWGVSSADGRYANIHGSTATQTGYLMPRKGTVISITMKIASGNLTKPVELRKNNGAWSATSTDYTFTPTGGTFSKTDLNLDFEIGDYLQTFFPSNGVPARDAVVMIEVAYRE